MSVPSHPPSQEDSVTVLKYDTLWFCFKQDKLAKVIITGQAAAAACQVKVKVTLGLGILLNDNKCLLKLGSSMIETYHKAGNPTKDYFSRGLHYSNYLDRGFDLVFADATLVKIILHTNQFSDRNFAFYDRCCFEIALNDDGEDLVLTPQTLWKDSVKERACGALGVREAPYDFGASSTEGASQKTQLFVGTQCVIEVLPET